MQEKTRFSYNFLIKKTRFSYKIDAFYARFSDFYPKHHPHIVAGVCTQIERGGLGRKADLVLRMLSEMWSVVRGLGGVSEGVRSPFGN